MHNPASSPLLGLDAQEILKAGVFKRQLAPVVGLYSGGSPTITAGGGTTPSIVGRDEVFVVTIGTGGVDTTVEITFKNPFANVPVPSVLSDTDLVPFKVTPLVNKVTIAATLAFTAGSKLYCTCRGYV